MAICSCLGPRILLILRSKHTVDGNNKMSHLNIVHIINNKISYIFLHNYRYGKKMYSSMSHYINR
jgi:hypothetical protein